MHAVSGSMPDLRGSAAEAALTEVPEHLLARSKAARARLTGESGGDAPAATPAPTSSDAPEETAAAAAPAAAPEPAPAPAPEPDAPWVAEAKSRHRMPIWAAAVLAVLPVWAVVYMTTNDNPTNYEVGPLAVGDEVYTASCSACHGSGGGGGSGPALSDGAVLETFPTPGEQVRWVLLGSAGYTAEGASEYGATAKPIAGGMPAWDSLEAGELLNVIRHERETLSGEEFDPEAWAASIEELAGDANPEVADRAAAWEEVLAEWAAEG